MKTPTFAIVLPLMGLVPAALQAQDDPPPVQEEVLPVEESIPSDLAAVERTRSRVCIPVLAELARLDRDLQPLLDRAGRISALERAIRLEDSTEVAPFQEGDALETAVRQWFRDDGELGRQWAQTQDSSIAVQRDLRRDGVLARLGSAIDSIDARGQARVAEAGDVQQRAVPCEGAIFVRPVVLEVCDTIQSPVCEAARDTASTNLRFVDDPERIWDVQSFRPWTDPTSIRVLPQGGLGGARTTAQARLGNVQAVMAVAPMIRNRAALTEEQIAEFEANLDSLEFTFEHPDLVFAPAIELQLNTAGPLGGENVYMLHFGDLSDPENQVVWSANVGEGGPLQAIFPAGRETLARLERGEEMSLTAVAVGEAQGEAVSGEAVYSIPFTAVNQSNAVSALLAYMAGGQFGQDLARLVPPAASGE